MAAAIALALGLAGIRPRALVLGGAATAVVVGLAAQQTLANVIAGTVLLNARTFRVGERSAFRAVAWPARSKALSPRWADVHDARRGADMIMVPNSVVLSVAVVPLRQPRAVDSEHGCARTRRPSRSRNC